MYTTSLSSKNQITLPVELTRKLGFSAGQKVALIREADNSIRIVSATDQISLLMGSLSSKIPKEIKKLPASKRIELENKAMKYGIPRV